MPLLLILLGWSMVSQTVYKPALLEQLMGLGRLAQAERAQLFRKDGAGMDGAGMVRQRFTQRRSSEGLD